MHLFICRESALYPIEVAVDAFGGLNRRVPEALGDIVEGVPALAIEHAIGDAVPERVRRHLLGGQRPSTVNGRMSAASTAAQATFLTDSVVMRSA